MDDAGQEPTGRFDLLAIDAFTSDAIPMHLLTREAVRLYAERLTERGKGVQWALRQLRRGRSKAPQP